MSDPTRLTLHPLLTIDPARMGGAITIRGTRLTLDTMRAVLASRGEAAACLAYPILDTADAHKIGAWSPKWPGRVAAVWGAPGDESSPWRYLLACTWEPDRPQLVVVGLNPSTASPSTGPDATCQRWLSMAIRWGFGGLKVVNLFALRATSPRDLEAGVFSIQGHAPRVVERDPDERTGKAAAGLALSGAGLVLCCWGSGGARFSPDDPTVMRVGHREAVSARAAFLHATRDGYPIHPLARLPGVAVSGLRPRDWITGEFVSLPIDGETPCTKTP